MFRKGSRRQVAQAAIRTTLIILLPPLFNHDLCLPDWLPAYARRTTRLTNVLRRVGFEVSAESGRRILRWFAITSSGDPLLRIVERTPLVPTGTPRPVGIDDWALRKGHRYGSLILDQETRQVVELLKARTVEDVQPWFQAHAEVAIVTRDRSPEYRKALTATAPQAQQVLDRWHLLLNLRHLAEHVIASVYRQLKKLPMPFELQSSRPRFLRSLREQQRLDASRQQRLDLYHEVQRLKQLGLNPSQMLQQLPIPTTPCAYSTMPLNSRSECQDAPSAVNWSRIWTISKVVFRQVARA